MDTHVLVVEDDAATATFLSDNLAADGYRVAVATSAAEGFRAIEVRRPHIEPTVGTRHACLGRETVRLPRVDGRREHRGGVAWNGACRNGRDLDMPYAIGTGRCVL
jgi:CheY-like chemotaxis protein